MSRALFILALVAVAVTGAVLAASIDNQLQNTLMEVIAGCNKTHKVDMNDIITANETGNFPQATKFKCIMRCIFESLQIGTEEQGYDPVKMAIGMQMIRMGRPDQTKFYDIAVSCLDKQNKGSGKCEKAYQYAKCMVIEELKVNGPLRRR